MRLVARKDTTQMTDLADILKRKENDMSIIIKGMDMPNSGSIVVEILPNGKVFPHTKGISFHHEAIQIPTPHGRIIDGDKLCKDFETYCSGECDCCVFEKNYNCGLIALAPTILESEE